MRHPAKDAPERDTKRARRGDFVCEHGTSFGIVLACGPRAFDVLWEGGSTSRYAHGQRDIWIVDEHCDPTGLTPNVVAALREDCEKAAQERRPGAAAKRGYRISRAGGPL